jgi:hypothetical protein
LVTLGVEAGVVRLALHVPADAPVVERAGVAREGVRDDILGLLARILRERIDPLISARVTREHGL